MHGEKAMTLNQKTETSVSGRVIFDADSDNEVPSAPKAHLDTVLTKLVTPPEPALCKAVVCMRLWGRAPPRATQ